MKSKQQEGKNSPKRPKERKSSPDPSGRALEWSQRELTIRNRIATVFLTVPDEEMYFEVLQVVLDVMESKYGVFGYVDENGAVVVPSMTRHIWSHCQVPDKKFVFPRETWGHSSWPRAIREKRTNYTNVRSSLTPDGHIPVERHISMPIVYREKAIGLIQVANKETDYNEKDIRLLESIGDIIAPILHARLQRDREEKARRDGEQRLRESEERFRTVAENLSDVIYEWDLGERIDWFGDVDRITGYEPGEFPRTLGGWAETLHPDDRGRVLAAIQAHLDDGTPYDTEYRVMKKDASCAHWTARGKASRDADGKPIRWIGSITDVTDKKKSEAALRKSEERFRNTFEQAAVGIAHVSPEGRFLRINGRFCEMVGFTAGEMVGTTFQDITHPADLEADLDLVRRVLANEIKTYTMVKRYIRKDGKMIWVNLTVSLVRGSGGEPQYFISVVEDITERKRMEETIQRQALEILELSTPVMQVWEGVVAAPLIGTLDSQRTQRFMERLLQGIVETGSSVALVDITGVPAIDTQTAQHLIETISAVRLLGADVVLTGVRPAIAQSLVHLGVDLSGIITRPSFRAGLTVSLESLGYRMARGDAAPLGAR